MVHILCQRQIVPGHYMVHPNQLPPAHSSRQQPAPSLHLVRQSSRAPHRRETWLHCYFNWLFVCWSSKSSQHPRSYHDGNQLVTVHTHSNVIVLGDQTASTMTPSTRWLVRASHPFNRWLVRATAPPPLGWNHYFAYLFHFFVTASALRLLPPQPLVTAMVH